MTFDVATQRTHLRGERSRDHRIEHGRVEVRTHLPDDETGPYIGQTNINQPFFEFLDESVESLLVGEAAVDLFGSYLVGNGGKAVLLAETLHVGDQLHRSGGHQADVDGLALGDVDVHGRIHVDEIVAGQDSGLEGLLDTVHGVLDGPLLRSGSSG